MFIMVSAAVTFPKFSSVPELSDMFVMINQARLSAKKKDKFVTIEDQLN